jgi:hypothetical protein
MSPWLRRRRYYCINLREQCSYALGDVPFDEKARRDFNGRCRSHDGTGCGAALKEGDPLDLRPKVAAATLCAMVLLTVLAWAARTFIFPPPLQYVTFASAETRVQDVGLIRLEVIRNGDLGHRVEVAVTTADGTAKAGEDYEPFTRAIAFERGERIKTIELAVLPDQTLEKGQRAFSLLLTNVEGVPRHVVRIEPRVVERGEQVQAEQMVLSASRIAADIAGFVVKRRVLLDMVASRSAGADEVTEYKHQLMDVQDNLSRAREGYAQSLNELQKYDAALILRTMDRVREDLAQRNFAQQSRALAIVRSQFKELAGGRRMDMDRWVGELEKAVPRLEPGNPGVRA